MNSVEAFATLKLMVAADDDPALTAPELWTLLGRAARVDVGGNSPANLGTAAAWVTATAYTIGDVVKAGDRWWRVTIPGTSGATVPTWPSLSNQLLTYTTVIDGTVTWVDNGGAWGETWDLNVAAARCWEMKAGKAAGRFDFTTDGQQFARSQIRAACMEMAKAYRRRIGGTIQILTADYPLTSTGV